MLYKVEVTNLFGVFNHSIEFKDGGITIILGENGLGKTVLLKVIKFFFDHKFDELGQFEFEELSFFFRENLVLKIQKLSNVDPCELYFTLSKGKKKVEEHLYLINTSPKNRFNHNKKLYNSRLYNDSDRSFYIDEFDEIISTYLPEYISKEGRDFWVDRRSNQAMDTSDVISRFSHLIPNHVKEIILQDSNIPYWLIGITGEVNAKLIETQRLLFSLEEDKYRSTVTRFSKQLVDMIKAVRSEANDLATKLDRTYTNRLIEKFSNRRKKVRYDNMEKNLLDLQYKRTFLNQVGLLDFEDENLMPIDDTISDNPELATVLQIYIEDSMQKLSIYEELAKKIEVFLYLINNRFKNKKLRINKQLGFEFKSTVRDKNIPLTGLSSGEQHLLVLFFELIFNTNEQSMLLIDEPEISLHITWQKEFIQDLAEIIILNNLNLIIATHSPDIIGNYWQLTTTLRA